jgi:hypothetical protein
VQQLTIGKIDPENELEKIRNAETGKPRKKIRLLHSSWLLGETHSRFKPGKARVGIFLCFSGENLDRRFVTQRRLRNHNLLFPRIFTLRRGRSRCRHGGRGWSSCGLRRRRCWQTWFLRWLVEWWSDRTRIDRQQGWVLCGPLGRQTVQRALGVVLLIRDHAANANNQIVQGL